MTTHIPFMQHCNLVIEEVTSTSARLAVTLRPELTNSRGFAHGGLMMTLLDIAMGRAAQASVPAAESFATIDTNFAFLSPARGRLVGEGRVVKAGRSIVFCEGECRDETGDLVARSSGVFTVLRANTAQTADDRPGALSGQPS